MLHQPDPLEHSDMLKGLLAIRELHLKTLAETGFTCADEMLYPENHAYLDDLLGYVAVGARSVEDQQHRLTASGLTVPVGMKNPTSGDYSVMLNAIMAAQHSHTFVYRGWEAVSQGNPYAHAILRGAVNKHGQSQPNYHYEDLRRLYDMLSSHDIVNPACIVDVNHSNSGKQFMEQIRIAKEVLHSRSHSSDIRKLIKGLMIESYLVEGTQKIGVENHIYGKSITDPCLGWEDSERLIYDIADRV
jgi:3-deoxy-7-phosphoheptulonate synthase